MFVHCTKNGYIVKKNERWRGGSILKCPLLEIYRQPATDRTRETPLLLPARLLCQQYTQEVQQNCNDAML